MNVEKLKYTIWAADTDRAVTFYQEVFGGEIVKQNPHITELRIAGGLISIHSGGEGLKTWTGITFQVPDVIEGGSGDDVITGGAAATRSAAGTATTPCRAALAATRSTEAPAMTRSMAAVAATSSPAAMATTPSRVAPEAT